MGHKIDTTVPARVLGVMAFKHQVNNVMDTAKRNYLKNTCHWAGVSLLIVYVLIRYALPAGGTDVSPLFPEVKVVLYLSMSLIGVGLYLHRCESCNKQMFGWVTTRKCDACKESAQ